MQITYGEKKKHRVIQTFLDNENIKELENEKYDIIILSHVLEHLGDPKQILTYVSRLLKENGCVYIEVPSTDNIGDMSDRLLDFFHVCHPWSFNKYSLQWLCGSANLKAIYIDRYIHGVFVKNPDRLNVNLKPSSIYYRKLIIADILSRFKLLGFKRKILKIIAKNLPLSIKLYIKTKFYDR